MTNRFADHPRCETCAHWVDDGNSPWDAPKGWKLCEAAPHVEAMRMWQTGTNPPKRVEKPEYAHVTMAAMDASSYRADVYAHPRHYCPMHSALKESA